MTTVAAARRRQPTSTKRSTFRTDDLTLDEQTYPSVAPLDGETVGVGMPVIVTFDVPVDRPGGDREAHDGDQHARSSAAPGTG